MVATHTPMVVSNKKGHQMSCDCGHLGPMRVLESEADADFWAHVHECVNRCPTCGCDDTIREDPRRCIRCKELLG